MAFSLSSGRRRWACRARAALKGGKRGAGCRHFHVHYHPPRQDWVLSPLRLPARFSPLPYMLILPMLFFAVLAFLVCFGWFTLLYFVSSLWSKRNDHESCLSHRVNSASDGSEPRGGDEEDRAVKHVAGHAGDDDLSQVCAESHKIKEVFQDGFSEESRHISRMALPGVCINDKAHASDEKIVQVIVFETNKELKAFAEFDDSSEKHQQVMDNPIDCFPDEVNTREFSTSLTTAKLLHVQYGDEFVANMKEMPVLSSLEILKFIDKHDTAKISVDGAGSDFEIREVSSSDDSVHHGLQDEHRKKIKQEQSTAELPVNSVANRLAEATVDECEERQNLVVEHNNNLADDDSIEEDGKQIFGISDEARDSLCETAGLQPDSVCRNEPETVATSNTPFDQVASDQEGELEEDLINSLVVQSSTSTSAVCDFADNHWRIIGSFATEESINEKGSQELSALETVEYENGRDDNCTSTGASSRLPLIRRSPSQWWNLCGVLHVFAGGED